MNETINAKINLEDSTKITQAEETNTFAASQQAATYSLFPILHVSTSDLLSLA